MVSIADYFLGCWRSIFIAWIIFSDTRLQAQCFSLFGHIAQMPDETDAETILTASPWRTGGDHWDTLIRHG